MKTKCTLCLVILILTCLNSYAQKITPVYTGKLRHTTIDRLDSVKKEFSEMLTYVYGCGNHFFTHLPDQGVVVTPDSVSFKTSKKEQCSFLCAYKGEIKVEEYSYIFKVYQIEVPNLSLSWKIKDLEYAKKFADDLVYFQHMKELVSVKGDKQFDSLAVQYRALKIKPVISEEERRYIVQANAMTQSKDYNRAIDLYEKAITLNSTNPMLYYNEALLLAMVGQYNSAINRMKKYLLLVPDAPDARAAQDKIYEWEYKLNK